MTMAGRPPHYCKDCSMHFDSDTSLRVHLQYHKENLLSMWAPQQNPPTQQCNNSEQANKLDSPGVTNTNSACEPTTSTSARITESPSSSSGTSEIPSLMCKSSASGGMPCVSPSSSSTAANGVSSGKGESQAKDSPPPLTESNPAFCPPGALGDQQSQYQYNEFNQFPPQAPGDTANLQNFQNGTPQQPFDPIRPAPPPYQSPGQFNVGFTQQQHFNQQQQYAAARVDGFYHNNNQPQQNDYNNLENVQTPQVNNNQFNPYWSPNSSSGATVDEKPVVTKDQAGPGEAGFNDSSAILDLDTNRLLFHGDEMASKQGRGMMMPLHHGSSPQIKMEENSWPGANVQPRDQSNYTWNQQQQQWNNSVPYQQQQGFGYTQSQHQLNPVHQNHAMHQRLPPSVMQPGMGPNGSMMMNSGNWYAGNNPRYPYRIPPMGSYPSPGTGLKVMDSPLPGAVVPDWMGGHHGLVSSPLSPSDYGAGKDEKRNRPFQCAICDKFFIRKGHLNRHLTTTAHKSRVSQTSGGTNCDSGISSASSSGGDAGGALPTLESGTVITSSERESNFMVPSPVGGSTRSNDMDSMPSIPVPSRIYPPHHLGHQGGPLDPSPTNQQPGGNTGGIQPPLISPQSGSTPASGPPGFYGQHPQPNFRPPNASPIMPHQQQNMLNQSQTSDMTKNQNFHHHPSVPHGPMPRAMGIANGGSPEGFTSDPLSNNAKPGGSVVLQSYVHYHQQQQQQSPASCLGPTPAKIGVGQLNFHQQQSQPQQETPITPTGLKPKPEFFNGSNGFNFHSQFNNNNQMQPHQNFTGGGGGYPYPGANFPQQDQPMPQPMFPGPKNVDTAPAPNHMHHLHQAHHHGLMAPVPAASAPTHQQPASITALHTATHGFQQQQNFGNSSPPSIAQTPPLISPYSPASSLSAGQGGNFSTPVAGSSPPSLANDDMGKKRLTCPICKKRSSTEAIHEEHMLVHKGEKPYKCTMCPKQFGHKTDLRRHLCLHTGEKPFACPVCGKRFIRKDHMTKHGEVHKKDDSFVMMTEFTDVGQHVV